MLQATRVGPVRRPVWFYLVLLFAIAELLRIGAALWLEHRNRQRGVVHEFADSELYWKLGLEIAAGRPYNDGKRQVLRTPGYPVFLAGCIRVLGPSTTGARHAQAAVGSASCILLFFLVRKLFNDQTAWIAAAWAACYPFAIFLSTVLLSESVFTFLLLAQLLCGVKQVESLSRGDRLQWPICWAACTGVMCALAFLVRPSWLLILPISAMLLPVLASQPTGVGRRSNLIRCAASSATLILVGVIALVPWWIRNWNVTGRFVPTTLWVGASLYDGWNEHATGASNMDFMNQPEKYGLDDSLNRMSEWEQDRYLRAKAWQFAKENPGRVIELAAIKFMRFWNPLPNAAEWHSWPLRLLSLLSCGPTLVLLLLGAWRQRRRWRVVAMLAGPVAYFCLIHLVFVSSVRYREAAILPALGLSASVLCPRVRIAPCNAAQSDE
jgi:4-amino-4-deoxy-L-arabinose transferase-like glycosyltransferase